MNYGYGLNTSEMLISLIIEICFGLKHLPEWLRENYFQLLPIFIIVIMILMIICVILLIKIHNKNEEQKQYYKFNIGEQCVTKEIKRAIKDKQGYYLINDVYFYNYRKGYHTQVDHVLITPERVFAIETKYWKGTTYIIKTDIKNKYKDSDINFALYEGNLVVNINDGEINLYTPNKYSNVINQTIEHAKNLRWRFDKHINFANGILVFVENDNCRLNINRVDEEDVTILSLNTLVQLIKEGRIEEIGKPNMKCENPQIVYEALLKYSRQKPNIENQELKKEIQELKKDNVRLSRQLKENK